MLRRCALGVVGLTLAACGYGPMTTEAASTAATASLEASRDATECARTGPSGSPVVTCPCSAATSATSATKSKVRLTSVSMSSDSDAITLTWTTNEPPPAGAVFFAGVQDHDVYAVKPEPGPDGRPGLFPDYALWVEVQDGTVSTSVGNFNSGGVVELFRASFDPTQRTLTASLPLWQLPGVEPPFKWDASLSIDDVDISGCPVFNNYDEAINTYP
jgi:hypothetical protein